jgi:hypothetical protein
MTARWRPPDPGNASAAPGKESGATRTDLISGTGQRHTRRRRQSPYRRRDGSESAIGCLIRTLLRCAGGSNDRRDPRHRHRPAGPACTLALYVDGSEEPVPTIVLGPAQCVALASDLLNSARRRFGRLTEAEMALDSLDSYHAALLAMQGRQ